MSCRKRWRMKHDPMNPAPPVTRTFSILLPGAFVEGEVILRIAENGQGRILVREDCIWDRPVDPKLWITPRDAAIRLRRVFPGHLVDDGSLFAQHLESMGKSDGHIEHSMIPRRNPQ